MAAMGAVDHKAVTLEILLASTIGVALVAVGWTQDRSSAHRHQPNLLRAFPDWGPPVAGGESVILRPDGRGAVEVVDRIPIGERAHLRAAER